MEHTPEFSAALGRTITVLRVDAGIDRRSLAERVGISYSYLSAIENGRKRASSPVLMTIADRLGLQLHQLLAAAEARLHRSGEAPSPTGAPAAGYEAELMSLARGLSAADRDLLLATARRLARPQP